METEELILLLNRLTNKDRHFVRQLHAMAWRYLEKRDRLPEYEQLTIESLGK